MYKIHKQPNRILPPHTLINVGTPFEVLEFYKCKCMFFFTNLPPKAQYTKDA